jgi:hypothetical protein
MAQHKRVEFAGKFWFVSELARLFGKRPNTVTYRMRQGMSLVEALNRPLGKGKLVTVNDAPMKITQLAKTLKLNPTTIRRRLRAGWSMQEVISPRQYRGPITAWNRTQRLSAWSRELEIHRSTLRRRLDSGLPPEVAFKLPVDPLMSRPQKGKA